ncbi:Bug family tripartite tricarboxylate transporter substrate binding protein [Variovorax terrae]|uniref:Tripartite tricarboxylate transporter substrate binding protein n=1 Tax=Variovorax terrae TaxID=2923278 RepID=A0A9X1VZ83_9BURK|nr:tripartite tricarboxylate transporter substrate binding protein [Variovorax terrae]MCJ0766182.1 tripartite tricarboxylate transporter substrate binding protein [Variovorax terrae]
MQRRSLIALGVLAATRLAGAQTSAFPDRPIRWIVGYPAGGGSDFVARSLAVPLGESLKQPLVIDNRAGAATIVAASAAKAAPADGYTIFSADLGTLVYNPLLYKKLPYDPIGDFAFIGFTVRYQFCLVCNPAFPAKNLNEVIAQAKGAGRKLDYASPGVGSTHHLTMEMFAQRARIEMVHTPYKGAAPALQDVMAGTVPLMMCDIATCLQMVKAGKLRPIAVASPGRSPLLPDVPTFEEAGVSGIDTNSWSALVAPKGTPAPVIARLTQELKAALGQPDTQRRLMDFGVEPFFGTPAEVLSMAKTDSQRWSTVVKHLNISLEY